MNEYKIQLIDGREINGLLKSKQPEQVKTDSLQLDTIGKYLSFGRRKPKTLSDDMMLEAQHQYNHHLFTENAWFLLANAEKILSDSRMFLAPVKTRSGLAYSETSGLALPTIGVYLEWWLYHKEAAVDKNGNLIWYISGNPLIGINRCMAVTPEGKHVKITQQPSLYAIRRSFIEVNARYTEAKQRCEAYTLEEVLIKLHGEDYRYRLVELKHEMIERLMELEKSELQHLFDYIEKKYHRLLDYNKTRQLRQFRKELLEFYMDYVDRHKVIRDLEDVYVKRHKELKSQLHAGTLEGNYYVLLAEASREYKARKREQSDLINKFIRNTFGKNLNGITPTDVIRYCKTNAD